MKTPAQWKAWFESEEFARQTGYQGPLGAAYSPSGTHLRLWAPTAQSVRVDLYRKGDGGACIGSLPLSPWGQGVWGVYLPGDQHGKYYNFNVTTEWGSVTTADPYARAAGVNGARSMIVDLARTDPPGWEQDKRPVIPASKRSVWEVNVRDFSQDPASGVRNAWRGKFLAFTQQGTTLNGDGIHPTCLNYLKRLGVRYVQLMPIFDFGSVDESRPLTRQYNWGYDPANYNVPEGSYSTDPARGEVRVRECKQMIQALHAAGIGVVMDVVYNHMYRFDNVLNRAAEHHKPIQMGQPFITKHIHIPFPRDTLFTTSINAVAKSCKICCGIFKQVLTNLQKYGIVYHTSRQCVDGKLVTVPHPAESCRLVQGSRAAGRELIPEQTTRNHSRAVRAHPLQCRALLEAHEVGALPQ